MSLKIWRPFKEWPPVVKVAVFMIPASLTVLLHQWLMPTPPETREIIVRWYQNQLQTKTDVFNFLVVMPFTEEAVYRWPSLLLLFVLLKQIAKRKPANARGQTIAAYAISITMMVASTAYWASLHDYPITVLLYGLLWGWLMFKTENPFYSLLFHALSNAFSVLFILAGYHLIYHGR